MFVQFAKQATIHLPNSNHIQYNEENVMRVMGYKRKIYVTLAMVGVNIESGEFIVVVDINDSYASLSFLFPCLSFAYNAPLKRIYVCLLQIQNLVIYIRIVPCLFSFFRLPSPPSSITRRHIQNKLNHAILNNLYSYMDSQDI